jgi:hypothetical protein
LASCAARARELAREPAPLPFERYPRGSGLAARLGLAEAAALVPGGARLALWSTQAARGPLVLAMDGIPRVGR